MEEQKRKPERKVKILAAAMAVGGLIVWIFSFISVGDYLRKLVQAGIGMIFWLVGAQYFLHPRPSNELTGKEKKLRFIITAVVILVLVTLLVLFLLK